MKPILLGFQLLALTILALHPALCRSETKPASPFTDHMVLQRDLKVPVWGTARPGAEVTVSFQGQSKSSKTDGNGKWSVLLDPMPANSTPGEMAVHSPDGDVKFSDVLVGEVWICSGQSNMDFPLSNNGSSVDHAKEEIESANYPLIRLLKIPRGNNPNQPATGFKASWEVCSPQTVPPFSGVAYFFGRELFQKLNVPIGLINTSYGGTPVEAWLSAETMKSEVAAPAAARLAETVKNMPQLMEKYKAATDQWNQESESAKTAGQPFNKPKPREPVGPNHPYAPVGIYNVMLHPLIPYGLRGAIWYQGEGNSSRASEYNGLLSALIAQWRKEWNQGDFPFYFVQLANYKGADIND